MLAFGSNNLRKESTLRFGKAGERQAKELRDEVARHQLVPNREALWPRFNEMGLRLLERGANARRRT